MSGAALIRATVAAIALAMSVSGAALAQSCTVQAPGACSLNTSASMSIPSVIQVLVTPPATPPAPPTVADFEAGFADFAGPTVVVRANTAWALSISAAASTWVATNTVPGINARTDKPAGDLLWSANGASFTPLALASHQLGTGPATNGFMRVLSYRVLYSLLLDTPGRYEMTVLLTVTAP